MWQISAVFLSCSFHAFPRGQRFPSSMPCRAVDIRWHKLHRFSVLMMVPCESLRSGTISGRGVCVFEVYSIISRLFYFDRYFGVFGKIRVAILVKRHARCWVVFDGDYGASALNRFWLPMQASSESWVSAFAGVTARGVAEETEGWPSTSPGPPRPPVGPAWRNDSAA